MKIYKNIKPVPIINESGFIPKNKSIYLLRKKDYQIFKKVTISGDAPKNFIRAYFYKESRKSNPSKWKYYIAKVGHKWYPNESITEYLLNRIGDILDMNMASSRLVKISNQIRFLSKYFINDINNQELVHGADIYAGFINDKEFIEEIEAKHLARTFFTVQFTFEALDYIFQENSKKIKNEFIKLLMFDAYIGNNDRHFYNWGVIKHLKNKHKPYFTPIYDTARGLLWNIDEKTIKILYNDIIKQNKFIENYSEHSFPKIGWEGQKNLNHFQLVNKIIESNIDCDEFYKICCCKNKLNETFEMIDKEFSLLMSKERIFLIKECIKYRHNKFVNFFN